MKRYAQRHTHAHTHTDAFRDTNSHHSWCGDGDGLVGSKSSQAVFSHFPGMITLKPLCPTPKRTCVSQSAGEKKKTQRVQSHNNPCAERWGTANNGGGVFSACESARIAANSWTLKKHKRGLENATGLPRGRGAARCLTGPRTARTGKKMALAIITGHVNEGMQLLPEQLNSCFCTSATLRPRSSAGEVHWVNSPTVGLWRSHCANQARWQSQCRLLEWRRLLKESKWNMNGEAALKMSILCQNKKCIRSNASRLQMMPCGVRGL